MSLPPDPVSPRHRRVEAAPTVRSANSSPRRRAGDPTPRRRKEDHKKANSPFAALLTVAVAGAFLAYVFNMAGFATSADAFFNGLDSSARAQNNAVVSGVMAAVPFAGVLIGAIILYSLIRWVSSGARNSKKTRRLASREVITLQHFKEITHARGIRPRIATAAYELLLPVYRSSMRARLDDRLREDLHMTDAQVNDLVMNLLRNTDRKSNVGDQPQIRTVMDMLQFCQKASRHSLMNSGSRAVAAVRKLSVIRPAARRITKVAEEPSQIAETMSRR